MLRFAPLLLLLPLAACDSGKNATEISLNATDDGGNTTQIASKDGSFSIKAPGFEGSIKLPGIALKGDNLDVNGVKLPPNSRIASLNAHDDKGDESGAAKIRFETEMAPDAARGWFTDQFAKRGFKAVAKDGGFTGTTDEGDPFALQLSAKGSGTAGTFDVTGKNKADRN